MRSWSKRDKLTADVECVLVTAGKWPIHLLQLAAYMPYHIRNGILSLKSTCQPLLLWNAIALTASIWNILNYSKDPDKYKPSRLVSSTDSIVQTTTATAFLIFHKYLVIFAVVRRRRIARLWFRLNALVSNLIKNSSDRSVFMEKIQKVRARTRNGALVVLFMPLTSDLIVMVSTIRAIYVGEVLPWQDSRASDINFLLASTVWCHETFLHGALSVWLSYLVRVQGVCLSMISHKLARTKAGRSYYLTETLSKSVTDFDRVEEIAHEFNKLYGHLLLFDFCYNGFMSTYFAYISPNLLLEGNFGTALYSIISLFIVGHRLYIVSSACSSYQAEAAEVQQNLLIIRTVATSVEEEVREQVISNQTASERSYLYLTLFLRKRCPGRLSDYKNCM